MTPFEIAMSIRESTGTLAEAILGHASERGADLSAAITLLAGWQRADEEFDAMIKCLEPCDDSLPLDVLVARSRAAGYNATLEAILARRWQCPHCLQYCTIEGTKISAEETLLLCTTCGELGVYPVDTAPHLETLDAGKPIK